MSAIKSAPQSLPLAFHILRVAIILLAITFTTFMTVAIVSGSMGGALLFVPSVLFGLILVTLLFKWARTWQKSKIIVTSVVAALFLLTGWYGFHVMFKFIQPTVWPKHAVAIGNPWVKGGNIFTENNFNNAVVVKLGDANYRMYFHDSDNMKSAQSADGEHFSDVVTLFKGEMPTVIQLPDRRWRMYYFTNAEKPGAQPMLCNSDNCPPPKHQLVSAVSSDGVNWTPESGVRLAPANSGYERDTMIHPTVIRLDDGSYKLYYDGEVVPDSSLALVTHYRKILSASSKDGLNWTRDSGYRIDEKPVHTWEAYSPKAMYANGKVILHFTTPNGIYEATSTDTLNFTVSKNPVFTPGRIPMPGDQGALDSYQDAYVLPDGDINRIYFWINGQGIFYASQKR